MFEGRYGVDYKAPIPISNVLINYSYAVKKTGPDEEKQVKAKLYIDCVNSSKAFDMVLGSMVMFEGKEYFVQKSKPVIGATEIHHYEVDLV